MRWLITLLLLVFFQWYSYQALKTAISNRWILYSYVFFTVIIVGNLLFYTLILERNTTNEPRLMYAIGFFLSLLIFQLLVSVILLAEDVFRIPQALYSFLKRVPEQTQFIPSRRKIISQIALGLASIPFASLLYGMYRGKYNYKVLSYKLEFEDLPDAFDGFKITQISDIHSGSFDNQTKVQYGVDLVNQQKSDLVLFTGDLVNNRADEIKPWIKIFNKIKAEFGVFSILGNHDYGDYIRWESPAAKRKNMEDLYNSHNEMGWDLLLNESRFIEKDGERLAIIGVENWGSGFKKAGDLNKALNKVSKKDFKILMTHDPSHWEAQVIPHPYKIHLTLSGHTHGMQFGIEIPGIIKWSPAKWRYKQWAGVYSENNQYLNVNRGFGYLAYPGRVGMWPEVSVITLSKAKSSI
ncbi:MAG: metallophosphoesterase [Flavobacteriaceae bacterium]